MTRHLSKVVYWWCLVVNWCLSSLTLLLFTHDSHYKFSIQPAASTEENVPDNQRTINLVLRMRNTRRELNDIRFEFQPSKVS